jgi:hypothetical protein
MPISLSSIRDLLLPGLRKVEGDYKMIPTQWDKVFSKSKSEMAVERTAEMRLLGLAAPKTEGGATTFDNAAGERYVYNQEHVEIALGYAVTRKMIDDNLYKKQFNPSNLSLQQSFAQTKEILCANVLNTANVYNTQVGADGVALCSASHPVDGTTVANTPTTQLDLSEAAIYSGLIQIRNFKNVAGLKMLARGKKLIVPKELEYVAVRLTKTELRPGTADNDVNALLHATNGLPEGYMVMDFLTSPLFWFMQTDFTGGGLTYMERVAFETDMQTDFTTDNLLVKGYERYSASYDNFRGIWGSFPTS